jgi:hypothetical protein
VGDDITCTITNNDKAGEVGIKTVQKVILHDTVTLTGYKDPAPNTRGTVTFRLYTDNTCGTEIPTVPPDGNKDIQVSTTGTASTAVGITVTPTTTVAHYWWKVTFSGDQFNAAKTGFCDEVTDVSATNN